MGHTSVQMTMDLYGHLMPDHLKQPDRRMDSFLAAYDRQPVAPEPG